MIKLRTGTTMTISRAGMTRVGTEMMMTRIGTGIMMRMGMEMMTIWSEMTISVTIFTLVDIISSMRNCVST